MKRAFSFTKTEAIGPPLAEKDDRRDDTNLGESSASVGGGGDIEPVVRSTRPTRENVWERSEGVVSSEKKKKYAISILSGRQIGDCKKLKHAALPAKSCGNREETSWSTSKGMR